MFCPLPGQCGSSETAWYRVPVCRTAERPARYLRRSYPARRPKWRGDRNTDFETERVVFNSELHYFSETRSDINMIRHRGLTAHIGQCLLKDKVHLNERGMNHYVVNMMRKEVRHRQGDRPTNPTSLKLT